ISAGENHVCALLDHGDLKCWGKNFYGALGLGDTINRGDKAGQMGDALASLNLGSGRTAIEISSQVIQTCALLDDHTVRCWGANMDGRLGQGDKNNRGATSGSMGDALMPIPLW
ncbi:MAG: RCC1 domain-containing protein, partial [Bdellovibrionota bacterium]